MTLIEFADKHFVGICFVLVVCIWAIADTWDSRRRR